MAMDAKSFSGLVCQAQRWTKKKKRNCIKGDKKREKGVSLWKEVSKRNTGQLSEGRGKKENGTLFERQK